MIKRFAPPLLALFLGLQGCTLPEASQQETSAAAPQEELSAEELIERGRRFLDLRQAAQAEPFFERALALDESSFEARLWLLRAWIDLGRSNDSLDAIDELRRAGRSGPKMEYLYGMAFLRRAQSQIAAGVTDTSPRMNFEDSAFRLAKTLKAYPSEYPDAYQGVAIAAWFTRDLERARWAGEHAVELSPWSPRAWLQLGRIAMSQFTGAGGEQEDEAWSEEQRAHHQRALEAFGQAIETLGQPLKDTQRQRLMAASGVELGHAYIWIGKRREAMHAYALAMAWAPEGVDYRKIQNLLASNESPAPRPGLFHQALEAGAANFQLSFGQEDTRDSGLLWWLGWERLQAGHAVGAELAFLRCVKKNPEIVNSWFYVALARFAAQNYAGGADALKEGWKRDSNIMVDSVQADTEKNLWILGQALSNLVGGSPFASAATNERAAMLARVLAEADPYDAWHWNNLGMFVRDQADALIFNGSKQKEDPSIAALYERSLKAYRRSLKLLPEDPGVINDTAVLLHYYLKRDQEEALAMYARSTELAEAALLNEELGSWERKRLETALRDSKENHRLLIEEQALEASLAAKPPAEPVPQQ